MYTYAEVLQKVGNELLAFRREGRKIIAIDGPDCSGKTTLSRDLCKVLMKKHTIQVVHYDDYANTYQYRTRKGEFSVEGFLIDFFDEQALINSVLEPHKKKIYANPEFLIVEGLFLLKPNIIDYFDYCIRLELPEELILSRALARDTDIIGTREWVYQHYTSQCIPAQRIYRASFNPQLNAQFIISTSDGERYEFCIQTD